MPVLDIQTSPRGHVPGLGLTDGDVGLLRGMDCDILVQGLIGFDRILIPPRYTFFLEAHLQRTPELSVLGQSNFRMCGRPGSLPRCTRVRIKAHRKD
jgi:hypothetical protein